ncbi:MAG: TonB-dependent receptor, partial [Tsuneonella sp.]
MSLLALAAGSAPALAQTASPAAAPPTAQDAAPPATDEPLPDDSNEIVVVATRLRGQVETASPPVVELDEQDVASYGASSIADLVAQLAPEIGSGRGRGGRPVFLVNGQRISNFREMSHYPPEAIRKVEVLPEEVALKYGYPADQRVINFILKDNFVSREVQAEYGLPTAGGYGVGELEGSLLRIAGSNRLNASLDFKNTSPLTEAERGIVQTPGSVPTVATDPDPAAYRSLVAQDSSIEANVTSTQGLGDSPGSGQFTINGQVIHDVSRSLSGLDTVVLSDGANSAVRAIDADPITRRSQTDTYSLGSVLNLPLGDWQFSTTLDASRTDSDTQIARRRDPGARVAAAAAGPLAIDGPLPVVPGAGFDRAQ